MLKEKLSESPILGLPRDEGMFIVDTDTSDCGIGAVLSQIQDGEERVLLYASRLYSKAEQNYCVTRKELLAVVYFLKQFRQYLLGRKFLVRTDHAALQWLRRTPEPIGQRGRWLELMEEFQFDVHHRPGRQHGNADALSRKPCRQCGLCDSEAALLVGQAARELQTRSIGNASTQPADASVSHLRLAQLEHDDQDIRLIYQALRDSTGRPEWESMLPESQITKTYWTKWQDLEMHDGVMYVKQDSR